MARSPLPPCLLASMGLTLFFCSPLDASTTNMLCPLGPVPTTALPRTARSSTQPLRSQTTLSQQPTSISQYPLCGPSSPPRSPCACLADTVGPQGARNHPTGCGWPPLPVQRGLGGAQSTGRWNLCSGRPEWLGFGGDPCAPRQQRKVWEGGAVVGAKGSARVQEAGLQCSHKRVRQRMCTLHHFT